MVQFAFVFYLAVWGGSVILLFGLAKLMFVPLAIAFETRSRIRRRRSHGRHRRSSGEDGQPLVSIIVPAFNEGVVLENCIHSLLGSSYANLEVVIIDDGSTDDTAQVMRAMKMLDRRIQTFSQPNRGKGAALNAGIAHSSGDFLIFVDADGIFLPETVTELLRGFDDPRIGAVCGDDHPLNLNRAQTKLLTLLSHVGTGMVRRALALVHCLPIVSGNIGAFPRAVVEQVGGFNEKTVGEDLELTWRVHKAGYRVSFRPSALVYAESPSTVHALWRQRVRWARGLIQTTRLHRRMVGNLRYGIFGSYLVVNTVTMLVVPPLQLLILALIPLAVATGRPLFDYTVLAVVGWLGLGVSLGLVLFAVALNGAWRDLRFLWTLILWPVYSTLMAGVVVVALWQEWSGAPAPWNKLARSGVVSRRTLRRLAGLPQ